METSETAVNVKRAKESPVIIPEDVMTDIMKCIGKPKLIKPVSTKKKKGTAKRLNLKCNERWLMVDLQTFSSNEYKRDVLVSGFKVFLPKADNSLHCIICDNTVSKKLEQLYEHLHLSNHANIFESISKDKDKLNLTEQYIKHVSNASVTCFCCHTNFANKHHIIDTHMKSKEHKMKHKKLRTTVNDDLALALTQLKNCWYNMDRFSCVFCNKAFTFKIEFLQHVSNHIEHGKNDKNGVFDFCITCASLWWGCKTAYKLHCTAQIHSYLKISNDFLLRQIPGDVIILLRNIDKTVNDLVQVANNILICKDQNKIVDSLKKVLIPIIPHVEIHPFGSRVNGLGTRKSDIDIFLDCGISKDLKEKEKKAVAMQYLKKVNNVLKLQIEDWQWLEMIADAKTPIIKLLHLSTGLHCDISSQNGSSIENTKLVRAYNTAYPPCQKLILFLKRWWAVCNISFGQPISSYGLAWLVIFYLQNKVGLPSVATLIKQHGKSKKIFVWEVGVAYPNCDKVPLLSIHQLLYGFFTFYANFDYINLVVCPLMGWAVHKKIFTQPKQLPKEMEPYVLSLSMDDPSYFRIDSPMCLQDPFDLAKNVTVGVRSFTLLHFKEFCRLSALALNISEP